MIAGIYWEYINQSQIDGNKQKIDFPKINGFN